MMDATSPIGSAGSLAHHPSPTDSGHQMLSSVFSNIILGGLRRPRHKRPKNVGRFDRTFMKAVERRPHFAGQWGWSGGLSSISRHLLERAANAATKCR